MMVGGTGRLTRQVEGGGELESAVVEAARFLSEHVSDPVGLGDVADHVGYSPFHLARAFERRMGIAPGRFLASHRFQLAKRLLLESDDRVVDVCYRAGFSSLGTFTARFGSLVGASPGAFRRLPDLLSDAPPEPLVVPGPEPDGGEVRGRAELSPTAGALYGGSAQVYVGLFANRAAQGFPVRGALLAEPGDFVLTGLPAGTYYLLAAAVDPVADLLDHLLPGVAVQGSAPEPVTVGPASRRHYRRVVLEPAESWAPPVLVALPRLASPTTQDWRSLRSP
jgi:AraC-like DNA-binding protein